jgi:DNA-binding HxlR family transcriptional regulator
MCCNLCCDKGIYLNLQNASLIKKECIIFVCSMKKQGKEAIEKRSDCPIACTMDVVGDKWSLLIIRDLLYLGKTTYNEFLSSNERISTNILNDRLVKLTEAGLITYTGNTKRKIYELTQMGLDLKPVLESVAVFGMKHSAADHTFLQKVKKTMGL